MKRSILKYVVISMLICITALSVNVNARDISVYYDGVEISFDVKPQIINSRTMVPLRAIFEALGASVEWDDTTKTVTSKRNDTTVELTIGQNYLKKNGEQVALDVPAQVVDSRTLVPVRAIAEAFGVDVYWRDEVKTVTIHEKGNIIYYFEMYKPDGSKANVEQNLTDKYEALGWGNTADDVKVTMYAPDGRSKKVFKSKVETEKRVGWYDYPVVTVYDINGNTRIISKGAVADYEKVGWYSDKNDVVVTMYAPDGRSKEVYKGKVESEKKVGWLTEPVSKHHRLAKYIKENGIITDNGNAYIFPRKADLDDAFIALAYNSSPDGIMIMVERVDYDFGVSIFLSDEDPYHLIIVSLGDETYTLRLRPGITLSPNNNATSAIIYDDVYLGRETEENLLNIARYATILAIKACDDVILSGTGFSVSEIYNVPIRY